MQRIAVALMVGLLVALTASSHAEDQSAEAPRLITVSGDAEVKVGPDLVELSLGVETFDIDVNKAKAENDQRVQAVLAVVADHGIESQDVQTDFLSIEPSYADKYMASELLGYVVSKRMVTRLEDVSKFESLLSAVLEAGANRVYGIDFQTSELRAHRDRARSLALTAAREKAEAMAGELGQVVGLPSSIREEPVRWPYGSRGAQNVMQSAGSAELGGVTPGGQISIHAAVTVSFELRQAETRR